MDNNGNSGRFFFVLFLSYLLMQVCGIVVLNNSKYSLMYTCMQAVVILPISLCISRTEGCDFNFKR